MRTIPKLISVAAILTAFSLSPLLACWINTSKPYGSIRYNPQEAITVNGSAETLNTANPTHLRNVTNGNTAYWLDSTVTRLSVIRGYAHIGKLGVTQQQANNAIRSVQIWGWLDTNGNGMADPGDAVTKERKQGTTTWKLLYEIRPSEGNGNAIGWDIDLPQSDNDPKTSTWSQNILQNGATIPVKAGESWIFLIRVVAINGVTNLYANAQHDSIADEYWDNGDTSDGIGSDIANDKYVDTNGNSWNPTTKTFNTDHRLPEESLVHIYVKLSK